MKESGKMLGAMAAVAAMLTGVSVIAGEEGRWLQGVTADVTVASKYIAHGMNLGGDSWSFQPTVIVETTVPGLSLQVWSAMPFDRDLRASDETDILIHYRRSVFGDKRYKVAFHSYADYWFLPHSPQANRPDLELRGLKYKIGAAMPSLIRLGGLSLVPDYSFYHWQSVDSGAFKDGGTHEMHLRTSVPSGGCPVLPEGSAFNLAGGIAYHDGAFGMKSGWSHGTAHVSLGVPAGPVALAAGINYQWSFEDTVNPDDEFWASFSATAAF